MRDIDYFAKERMNRSHIGFYNSLPNDRLKKLFNETKRASGHTYFDSDVLLVHKTDTFASGIDRITCGWHLSALINFFLIGGWIWFLHSRIQECPTISFYFEATTGVMLSATEAFNRRDNNKAAEEHFESGKRHENDGKFRKAHDEYEKACQLSCENYTNKSTFETHRDQIKNEAECEELGAEGDLEMNIGNYDEALDKLQKALNRSEKQKDLLTSKIESVRKEKSASNIKNEGERYYAKRDYKRALETYKKAAMKSTLKKSSYDSFIKKAQTELNAVEKADDGLIEYNAGNYDKAVKLYEQAINTSQDTNNMAVIRIQLEKAQNELNAFNLKEEGDQLFLSDQFHGARQKYESARNTSTLHDAQLEYESLIEKATIEASAASHAKSGLAFLAKNNFESAEDFIKKAFLETCSEKFKDEYRKMLDGIRIEKKAAYEAQLGDDDFQLCEYELAKTKYSNAYLTSNNQETKSLYKSLLAKANNEINVDQMANSAHQAFAKNDLQNAKKLFETVIQQSEHETHKQNLKEMMLIIENEIEAVTHAERARHAFIELDFKSAKEELTIALNKSTLEIKKLDYQSFLKEVNAELTAFDEKEAGDAAYKAGDYHFAKEKYINATLNSILAKIQEVYRQKERSTNIELQAISYQEVAMNNFQAGMFKEATSLFKNALDVSGHDNHKCLIKKKLDMVDNEIKLKETKQNAEQYWTNRNYKTAFEMCKEVGQNTIRNNMRLESGSLQKKCENEIQAQSLKESGDEFFDKKEYDEAVQAYNQALEKSNVVDEKKIYSDLLEKAKAEANCVKEEKLGAEALKERNYNSAKLHYNRALSFTRLSSTKATLEGSLNVFELLPGSHLCEQVNQLIEKAKSKVAQEQMELALNDCEKAREVLCSLINSGNSDIFGPLEDLVRMLKNLGAEKEVDELLGMFRAFFAKSASQIDSIQAKFDDNRGPEQDYLARSESKKKFEKQTFVQQFQR